MRYKVYRLVRTFGLSLPVLLVTACGSTSAPSSGMNPASPTTSTTTVASGPMLGAWWDSTAQGLRIVYGVPGAAYQGAASYTGGGYSGAFVCMRQKVALLTTSAGALSAATLPQGIPVAIAGQALARAKIVFSPSCTSALAFAPGNPSALLLQNLLSNVRVSSLSIPAGTAAAAVADSGSVLVSTPQSDGTAAIQLFASGGGTQRTVTVLSKFGDMAFLPGTDTALLADKGASAVVEASQLTGSLSLAQVAGTADGIAQPVSIAVSGDGHAAAVLNQSGSTIVRIDLTGQTAAVRAVCHCTPSELEPLAGNLTLRLNEAGTGTVWAYDGNAASPRFAFIPVSQTAGTAKGAAR